MTESTQKARIDFIDFAKALAILGVALYHYMMPLNPQKWFQLAITFGGTGIHLFFFLSGFGLGLSKQTSAWLFYKRRFLRVLAPYYLFVTAVFLFNHWVSLYPMHGWRDYLSHIFLFKMFYESHMGSFGFHLWFMSTLVQLYLFFPLLCRILAGKQSVRWVIFFTILSVGYNLIVILSQHASMRTWNSFFLAYLWEFALGIWMGQRRDERLFRLKLPQSLMMWMGGLAGMALFTLALGQAGRLLNDIFAFLSITGFVAFAYDLTGKTLSLKKLRFFFVKTGGYSYEYYLVHYVGYSLMKYYEKLGWIDYGWWAIPLMLLFSSGLALLLSQTIKLLGLR